MGEKLNPLSSNIILMDDNHNLVSPELIPTHFNEYFSTVFSAPSDVSPRFAPITAASSAPINFPKAAVLSQLNKLKTKGPAGVDLLPPLL